MQQTIHRPATGTNHIPDSSAGRQAPAGVPPATLGEASRASSNHRWHRVNNVLIAPTGTAIGTFVPEYAAAVDALLAAANRPAPAIDLTRVAVARDQVGEALDLIGVVLDLRSAGRHVPDVQFGVVQDALVEAMGALGKVVAA